MKKTFLTTILAVITVAAFAQGNLQFNQVKLVTAQETVPAGKVWKVESVIYNIPDDQSSAQTSTFSGCGSISYFRSTSISVNGISTKIGQGTTTAAYSNLSYTHTYTPLPFWLPAGSTLSGGPCLNQVSVIEFNVVP